LRKANVEETKKVSDWSDDEVARIRSVVDTYRTEGQLRSEIQMNINVCWILFAIVAYVIVEDFLCVDREQEQILVPAKDVEKQLQERRKHLQRNNIENLLWVHKWLRKKLRKKPSPTYTVKHLLKHI